MQELGQLLLLVTFFVTLSTALTAIAGAVTRNARWMTGARYGLYAAASLYVAMALVLLHGFLTHDFSNTYISAYSDRSMPTLYLIASFWGGEKGALLLWTTSLSVFGAIAIHTRRHREQVYLSWALAVLALAIFFFDVLMVFESNPFEVFVTSAGPMDGKGLNPLLQNPTMAFHPPSLLTGYIAFTIPFAFGIAALITGKLDSQWIEDSRTWTIISWCFLSVGLILGALWAYQELGWGFYWMWDPVENAGFIPWLTGTAYLHSVMIQERRGMLRRWNVVLVCLTFLLTIFGTFLTRSQLIDSIHAFADSTLAIYFLWYMVILLVICVGLIAWRWGDLRSDHDIESLWSRESMFVMNNVFLVGSAFIVMWGTLFPKVSELQPVQGAYNGFVGIWNTVLGSSLGPMDRLDQAVSLAEPWFNRVMTPIGLLLLLVMGAAPLIPWRRASLRVFRRNFLNPLTGSAMLVFIGTVYVVIRDVTRLAEREGMGFGEALSSWTSDLEMAHGYMVLAYVFSCFVLWSMGREFVVATRVRRAKVGGGYGANLLALIFKSPRRYGGYIIHVGIVLMFVAFTGKVFKDQQPERPMNLGDQISSGTYHLTYREMDQGWHPEEGFAATRATITVLTDGETVASREVEDLVAWLTQRGVGAFHVETTLESPKMVVRFEDHHARDILRDDFFLERVFLKDFTRVADDNEGHRQIWRITDTGLLKVVPILAMSKSRRARAALGPGSTVDVDVELTPGSPRIVLDFDSAEEMAAFDERLSSAEVPENLAYGAYNVDLGALEFIDRRTGTTLVPEVRFFAKHDTPTTETAIASTLYEDLYLAMRPSMGQGFINMLVVVFPLVSFLWTGAILLILGTLVCLSPPWLSRTVISLSGSRRAAVGAIVLLVVTTGLAGGGTANAALPIPRGMAAPEPGHAIEDTLGVLTCPCLPSPAQTVVPQSLADSGCDCPTATDDRGLVTRLMSEHTQGALDSGRAKLAVLRRLVALDPHWDARLRYPVGAYQHLVATTKTTCPGERGLTLAQAQITCSVRNEWLPRFRAMLSAGMDPQIIFQFYVDENNVTMAPPNPWTYEDLQANPDKALSWAFPFFLIGGLLVVLLTFIGRRARRSRVAATAPVESAGDFLTARQRLLLEDELDLLDG